MSMPNDAEKARLLKHLKDLEAAGEQDYDDLYQARSDYDATVCYSGAKEAFYDAISIAHQLGMEDEAERLSQRLDHIKAVFRSQFSDW
jgi:hypothetical protein